MLRGRMERGSRGAVALRTRVIRRLGGGGGCEEKNGILAKLENAARPYWAHPDRIHTRRHALMSRVFPRPAGKLLQILPQMRPPLARLASRRSRSYPRAVGRTGQQNCQLSATHACHAQQLLHRESWRTRKNTLTHRGSQPNPQ